MFRMLCLLALGTLASCGQKAVTSLPADLPDNASLKAQCFALGQEVGEAVPVDFDDQANVRLCAIQQKDGHLALDLRYTPHEDSLQGLLATLTVQSKQGQTVTEEFPLVYNEGTGSYELYVSRGCLVGSFGGCAAQSTKKMQELLAPIESQKEGGSNQTFLVKIEFTSVKSQREEAGELKPRSKFSARIPSF